MAPRTVKKASERKEEILKTAQDFFYTKGYESTSIEDIINRIGIAKGTFYHYFKSKEDLLSELVDFQTDGLVAILEQKLENSGGDALDKFRLAVSSISDWKLERKDLMITYMEVLYRDENVPLRFKMYESYQKIAPVFSKIIAAGQKEGIFNVTDPEDAAEIFISMLQAIGERMTPQVLLLSEKPETAADLNRKFMAFENTQERLLGLKDGTLKIYDPEKIREFFDYYIKTSGGRKGSSDE